MSESTRITAETPSPLAIAGKSEAMQRLRASLREVAPLDSTILLTGETGAGKGRAARELHDLSPRAARPFLHVDCAALSPTLIESELFGHEKGAFTNAVGRREGRFELAGDGTIFLDEIGDLDPRLQAKLLRVLDDRAFERLGGTQTLRMRARIVAATRQDLHRSIRENRFRLDLYFRLSVFHLMIPPLRERLEDLPALVCEGLARLGRRLGVAPPLVTEEFLVCLHHHAWPGNVRELLNVLERLVVARRGERLRPRDLEACLATEPMPQEAVAPSNSRDSWKLPDLIQEVAAREREEIIAALQASDGCVAAAARHMQVPRSTLRHRMKKHVLGGA